MLLALLNQFGRPVFYRRFFRIERTIPTPIGIRQAAPAMMVPGSGTEGNNGFVSASATIGDKQIAATVSAAMLIFFIFISL